MLILGNSIKGPYVVELTAGELKRKGKDYRIFKPRENRGLFVFSLRITQCA